MRSTAALVAALALLAGCGSTEKQQAEDVGSIAAEGALLAHDAAEGSTTETFTRVHGQALRDLAQKIADAPQSRVIGRIAEIVASDLEVLATDPGDEAAAAQVENRLERAAKVVSDIGRPK